MIKGYNIIGYQQLGSTAEWRSSLSLLSNLPIKKGGMIYSKTLQRIQYGMIQTERTEYIPKTVLYLLSIAFNPPATSHNRRHWNP